LAWNFGNTTVRTPYRLQEALKALQSSTLNGNIIGKVQENAFAKLLHDTGVVNSPRVDEGKEAGDLGRKWRVALAQLGFITPKLKKTNPGDIDGQLSQYTTGFPNLTGRPFEITPNGARLLNSKLLPEQQECFLRAIATYRIPSPIEKGGKKRTHSQFSPLRFTLNVMQGVEEQRGDPKLTFQEFAFFVQTSTPDDGIDDIVREILSYRDARVAAKGKVKAYDKSFLAAAAEKSGLTAVGSIRDYADTSFRYLKATGLFKAAGKGITLNANKVRLATLIRDEKQLFLDDQEYLHALWRGAKLPTDNVSDAYIVLMDLQEKLKVYGVTVTLPHQDASIEVLKSAQYNFEDQLSQQQELQYAADQANQLEDIFNHFGALPLRSGKKDFNGVKIPNGEGPAYLEWVIWRAFLAIDSLVNAPWEARRFQIDQDFLPVHCAPGGGPDMIFEFEDMVVVVEVTLTDSSRQEAAEGEPVRRHVADYVQSQDKPVYGLFVALNIDSNTAHTFRLGDWYLKDDTKINLHIVPVTLLDFQAFLESGRHELSKMPALLRDLIKDSRMSANMDAPQWKAAISRIFNNAKADSNVG